MTKQLARHFRRALHGFALLVIALMTLSPTTHAQDIEWARQFGTTGPAIDHGWAVAVGSNGVSYVAGSVRGQIAGQVAAGGEDAFVRAYDPDGNVLWTRQFGSSKFDYAFGVAASENAVYVVGSTEGSLLPDVHNTSSVDWSFLRKYSLTGDLLWTHQTSFIRSRARSISVSATGIYVAGTADSDLDGSQDRSKRGVYIRRFSPSGTPEWTAYVSPDTESSSVYPPSLSATADGIFVSGFVNGILPDSGSTKPGEHVFVRRIDSTGNTVWTRQFGGGTSCIGTAIRADSTGIYVGGNVFGNLTDTVNWAGSHDAFLRKFDLNGNVIWTRQWGSTARDSVFGIHSDASGIYAVGGTEGTIPGATMDSNTSQNQGFARKLDAAGDILWTRQFQGIEATAVALSPSGVFAAGNIAAQLSGQSGWDGSRDVFLRKFATEGSNVWGRQFGSRGPTLNAIYDVVSDGTIYTTGILPSIGAGFEPSFVRAYDTVGNKLWSVEEYKGTPYGLALDSTGIYESGISNDNSTGSNISGTGLHYLRKYDRAGHLLWIRRFGSEATPIAASASGIYVPGYTTGAVPGYANSGKYDITLRKFTADGTLQWARQYGGSGDDIPIDIAADSSGIYMTGRGFYPFSSAGNSTPPGDQFVGKWDQDGVIVWTRQIELGYVSSIAVAGSSVYVAGFAPTANASTHDFFVRKYDLSGGIQWTRRFGVNEASHIPSRVAADTSAVYVSGGPAQPLPSSGGIPFQSFVRKYDTEGLEQWTRQFSNPNSGPLIYGLSVDETGLYAAGSIFGVPMSNQEPQAIPNGIDALLIKYVKGLPNRRPEVSVNQGTRTVNEGQVATNGGTYSDLDANDNVSITASIGTITKSGTAAGTWSWSMPTTDGPSQGQIVTITADDGHGGTAMTTFALAVNNVAPSVNISVPAPGVGVAVGTAVTLTGGFSDPGTADTHSAQWLINSSSLAGTISGSGSTRTVSNSYTFSTPGIYTLKLTVTDKDGGVGQATTVNGQPAQVFVFDPEAGALTGGGLFEAAPGSFPANSALTVRVNFAMEARYQKNSATPLGKTSLRFNAGGFDFQSTSNQLLIITGERAILRGLGTLNGSAGYAFLLAASDERTARGEQQSKIRIRIWNVSSATVVFDNIPSGSADFATTDLQSIAGGNIRISTK